MRLILSILMLGAIAWSCALLWFLRAIPAAPLLADRQAEALVVLTGGTGRVEHGLDMLAQGAAPVLFISGVGEKVTEEQLLGEHADDAVRKNIRDKRGEIVMDHISRSTISNAGQSAAFLSDRGIDSIRLITANYHMPRSMHEFRVADPDLEIIADPVFPEGFHRNDWWKHENSRRLLFSEFHKYFAALLRDSIRP